MPRDDGTGFSSPAACSRADGVGEFLDQFVFRVVPAESQIAGDENAAWREAVLPPATDVIARGLQHDILG